MARYSIISREGLPYSYNIYFAMHWWPKAGFPRATARAEFSVLKKDTVLHNGRILEYSVIDWNLLYEISAPFGWG